MIPKSILVTVTVEVRNCDNCPHRYQVFYDEYICDFDNGESAYPRTDGKVLYEQNASEMTETCPLWIDRKHNMTTQQIIG